MKKELLHNLVLAVANSPVPDEVAFAMVTSEFEDSFDQFYKEYQHKESGGMTPAIYAMAMCVLQYCPDSNQNIVHTITNDVVNIIKRMHVETRVEMITHLACRATCKQGCRDVLRKQSSDRSAVMYNKLQSNRFDTVFEMFISDFKQSSASGYAFTGSFSQYVITSFYRIFYTNRKRDIWGIINRIDTGKSDFDFCREIDVTTEELGDFPIAELVRAIGQANILLFKHTGHDDRSYGICYDIVALLIEIMAKRKVDEANKRSQLRGASIRFKYDRDGSVFYDDPSQRSSEAKKGIVVKIDNAWEIVEYIYDCLEEHRFSLDSIYALRIEAMRKGCKAPEGRNCPWGNSKFEPAHSVDSENGVQVYETFNIIAKGIISAHSLLMAMKARGMNIIDSYNKNLFLQFGLIRHADFLSELPYIPRIMELQERALLCDIPIPENGETPLVPFNELLRQHAGAETNGKWDVKHNRQNGELFGLLDNTRLKQLVPTDSVQTVTYQTRACLLTLPRCAEVLVRDPTFTMFTFGLLQPPSALMHTTAQANMYFNRFFVNNKEAAAYYLSGRSANLRDSKLSVIGMQSFGFVLTGGNLVNLGASSGAVWCGVDAPLRSAILSKDTLSGTQPEFEVEDFWAACTGATRSGILASTQLISGDQIVDFMGLRETFHENPLGFSAYLGLTYRGTGVSDMLEKQLKTTKYKAALEQYFAWYSRLAEVQFSIMDCLKAVLHEAYCLILSKSSKKQSVKQGTQLWRSFNNGCFNEGILDSYLKCLYETKNIDWLTISPNGTDSAIPVNRTMLDLIFNYDTAKQQDEKLGVTALASYYSEVSEHDSPAKRFAKLYATVEYETAYLLLLRDAFEVVAPFGDRTPPLLVCEMNSRFGVLSNLRVDTPEQLALATIITLTRGSISSADVDKSASRNFQTQLKAASLCAETFQSLASQVKEFILWNQRDITNSLNYTLAGANDEREKLYSCGRACFTCSGPAATPEFAQLRAKTTHDETGFLTFNNTLLTVIEDTTPYYIFVNGMIVSKTRGEFAIYQTAQDVESDIFYRHIIEKALNSICG